MIFSFFYHFFQIVKTVNKYKLEKIMTYSTVWIFFNLCNKSIFNFFKYNIKMNGEKRSRGWLFYMKWNLLLFFFVVFFKCLRYLEKCKALKLWWLRYDCEFNTDVFYYFFLKFIVELLCINCSCMIGSVDNIVYMRGNIDNVFSYI